MFSLEGVYCPIATPFENGKIAYNRLAEHLDYLLDSDLKGIAVMGSNGEFVSLTEAEKEALVRFCCKRINGRKRVLVGSGSNCIEETFRLNNLAGECGADGVLLVTPFYYKGAMKDAVLERYFTEVAEQAPVPIVLYNMPRNTGINLSSALQVKLSFHPNIIGVKDTGGDIVQITNTIQHCAPDFSVFAGNWAFLMPSLLMGAKGGTLALANIAPNECAKLVTLVHSGNLEEARALTERLMPVNAAVTTKYGVSGLKAAMEMLGFFGGEPRAPLYRVSQDVRDEIRHILKTAALME
jgi:Dihydrodipicolinate synthase/N-acetylneuraminate lyase